MNNSINSFINHSNYQTTITNNLQSEEIANIVAEHTQSVYDSELLIAPVLCLEIIEIPE